jgi:dipeptidyl-peptidase 4
MHAAGVAVKLIQGGAMHSKVSRIRVRLRTLSLAVVLALLPAVAADAQQSPQELRTTAERSGFTEYTPYTDMMEYLADLRARSTDVRMGIYGQTWEGRELPYLVFSRPAVTRGWEAAALGRPVVEIHANVHGGERTLRESLLIMVRDLATPGTELNDLLDHMVIIVSPQVNPDGFEARPGPTRGNAWGIDMNRDYMKLEQPSIVHWVQNVFQEWNPHLFVDGHNGGQFPYNLKYQCPGHADPDQRITALCDGEIFPRVDERLEAEGFHAFYWASGNEERWSGGQTDGRISRNYAGFVNSIGILFESPGWQEMEDGVRAGVLGYTAVLEYVRDHPDRVMNTVNEARRQAVLLGSEPAGEVAVQMDVEPEDELVDYMIGVEVEGERQIREITEAPIYKRPVATLTRTRPYAYILPRDAVDAVDLLRRHNITVEVLDRELTVEVEAYTLEGVSYEAIYNHQSAPKVEVGEVVTLERSFPPGTYVVPVGQMMGRVASHLLEPETDDNLIYWGAMDRWLPLAQLEAGDDEPALVPIYKLMRPTPVPARIMR